MFSGREGLGFWKMVKSAGNGDFSFCRVEGEGCLYSVDPISVGEGRFVYDIWISPKTGDDVARCPWLRKLPGKEKYACRIHDVKPVHCREYPRSREHAAETGCKEF